MEKNTIRMYVHTYVLCVSVTHCVLINKSVLSVEQLNQQFIPRVFQLAQTEGGRGGGKGAGSTRSEYPSPLAHFL